MERMDSKLILGKDRFAVAEIIASLSLDGMKFYLKKSFFLCNIAKLSSH